MVRKDILIEIDETLDRLICNAEAIQYVSIEALSETEIDAFQKTQESLLQHLLHLDACQGKRSQSTTEKLRHFEKLKSAYHSEMSQRMHSSHGILSKRKAKKILYTDRTC